MLLQLLKNKIPGYCKYITTLEFNKLTTETITARLKQINLATKDDIADIAKKPDFNDKLKI